MNNETKKEELEKEKANEFDTKDQKTKKEKKGKTDFKKLIADNKKWIIIGLVVLLVVIIAVVLIICLSGSKDKESNQKEKLEARMGELAKNFYEVQYYPGLSKSDGSKMSDDEKKEFAAKFKDTGITVGLDSLARVNAQEKEDILKEFVNEKTGKKCDVNNTKVIIYPKDPYKSDSYTFEVILDCGFDEK